MLSHLHDWALPMSLTNIKLRLAENVALSNTLSKYFDSRCLDVEVCKTCISQHFFSHTSFYMECQFKMDCLWNIITQTCKHSCMHTRMHTHRKKWDTYSKRNVMPNILIFYDVWMIMHACKAWLSYSLYSNRTCCLN